MMVKSALFLKTLSFEIIEQMIRKNELIDNEEKISDSETHKFIPTACE